jgi:hypothetical protein
MLRATSKLWHVLSALPQTRFYWVMRRISRTLLTVKLAVFIAALALLALDAVISLAHAQTARRTAAAAGPNYKAAYDEALTCWRATVAAQLTWPDKREWFEESSKVPFNAALKLGHLLGYNNTRLNADLGTAAQTSDELDFNRNAGLLAQKIDECQSLGLALR